MADTFLQNLDWRFATKEFDPAKNVADDNLNKILKAIQLAPSSRGWQPWQVVVVADQKIKQQLYPFANNQKQVVDCSHLLVFCIRTDLKKRADDYLREGVVGKTESEKEFIRQGFNSFVERKEKQGVEAWAGRQAYIALGFALAACAELKIDSCPMEGFQPAEFDKVLDLPNDIRSVALLPIGYRLKYSRRDKFRFSKNDLFLER